MNKSRAPDKDSGPGSFGLGPAARTPLELPSGPASPTDVSPTDASPAATGLMDTGPTATSPAATGTGTATGTSLCSKFSPSPCVRVRV